MEEKLYCRKCKGLRNHRLLHEEKRRGEIDEGYLQWMTSFSIIECLGCETISFLEIYGDTNMVGTNEKGETDYFFNKTIYPYYSENVDELECSHYIPSPIIEIYNETLSAYKSNCYILAAGGLRAIIEAICNHLKIKKGNLAERIDLLHDKGYLTIGESKRLHSIRFLGNDALHEIENPKKESLIILFEIVNHLLDNLFISDKKIKGRVETIIDNYDDYLKLIQNKTNKNMIGKEMTISHILGKSFRLIPNKHLKMLENKFKHEITNGKVDFISIIDDKSETIYRIEKEPAFVFDW
jgi:hypothetical protein